MQNNSHILFDRSEILGLLEKRVNDVKDGYRQNIALIGQRLIGKTATIRYFLSNLNDNKIVYIYLESSPFEFKTFVKKFIGGLLNSVAHSENISFSNDVDILINSLQKFIPQTIEHIKKIMTNLDKEKNSDIYNHLINLPDVFTKETGKACLVILDEFQDIIETLNIENAYQDLSKKITVQRNCMYIVISSFPYKAKKILTEKLSLLFGNFEIIEIKPFDIKTTKDFISQKLEDINLTTSLQNFLFNLTGGHPFYLEIICCELLKLARSSHEQVVTLSMLSACLNTLLFEEWGILNQLFKNYLEQINQGKNRHLLSTIILSIAKGRRRINDITTYLHKQKITIAQNINKLIETDVLAKNGNFYYLSDKMFNFWLKFIYLKKLDSITEFNIDAQTFYFRPGLEKMIENFIRISERTISERLVELFNLFENESVQMNGYKYRLFRFKDLKTVIFNEINDSQGLIAHSKNILWLFLIKEDILKEEDVIKFITECKNYKHKPQRRIIISLADTDTSAKLKALQEKVWVWNIKELNLFLNLYDKPYIIK